MSIRSIRTALETAINGMSALATAWENVPYTPVTGTPYQRVFLLVAQPDNRVLGSNYTEQGILQVSLMYPINTGTNAAATRAELLRTTFKRGNTYSSGGITVLITKTPEIGTGTTDGDRFVIPVKIRWSADILS